MPGHNPITETKPYPQRTLCEVHREIYRELRKRGFSDEHPIIVRLFEAYDMGVKMNNKLRQYKHNYDDGWWKENKLAGGKLTDKQDSSNT